MFITIFRINESIIVFKILTTCVIRWVDVDNINPPSMSFFQQPEAMQVIAFALK